MDIRGTTALLGATAAACVAAVAGHAAVTAPQRYAQMNAPDPGAATAALAAGGSALATLLGAVTLGALLYVVVTARTDRRGVIDPPAFRAHLLGERAAGAWLVCAAVTVPVQAAASAGTSVTALLGDATLFSAVTTFVPALAWVVVAACAAVVTTVLRLSVRWTGHAVALVPAAVGVVAFHLTGNAGQGPDHDYGVSTALVFWPAASACAGLLVARLVSGSDDVVGRRADRLAAGAATLAVGYGALLLALWWGPGGATGSDFGRLGLLAAVAGLATCGAAWAAAHPRLAGRRAAIGGGAAICAAVALTAMTAMDLHVPPRLLAHRYTGWDVLLGYELTAGPDLLRILTTWRFDTFLGTVGLALAALYGAGVVRLRRRGDRWSTGRTIAWVSGCLALVVATGSGLRTYGSAMFGVHMIDHMALNMFVPVLLVLGAPVTLALRALPAARDGAPPGPREWILTLVHSRVNTVFTHPLVAFALFVGSVYAVYFTPLFDTFVRYHWGHELMSVHFLLTGYLFFWLIIGIDPGPRRLPFLARLGLLFAVMPFHAFFGIATMTMSTVIGSDFYRSLALPWVPDLLADQRFGGAVAWGTSEVPVVIVVIALVTQWARQDRRTAVRSDRAADREYGEDELEAYNAMLRELSRSRR